MEQMTLMQLKEVPVFVPLRVTQVAGVLEQILADRGWQPELVASQSQGIVTNCQCLDVCFTCYS